MARAANATAVSDGVYTTLFESRDVSGNDGEACRGIVLAVDSGAAAPAEFRVDPTYPDGGLIIAAGSQREIIATAGNRQLIRKVEAQGSGGASAVSHWISVH